MKPDREYEQACAVWLVQLLVAEHRLPICVREVRVAQNWKTKFRFQHLRKFSAFDYDCNMRES